jgi:hypothetical protein
MKLGFEVEAFCLKDGKPVLPTTLPIDECGWLAEVRSEPHTDVRKAIYLLMAEMEAVEALAAKEGITLSYVPLLEIPRDLKVQAARAHGKGQISYRNIYGHECHKNSTKLQTASLHISFTEFKEFVYYEGADKNRRTFNYPGFVDHAKIIASLDKAFKEEIWKAKRNPGFYEVKGDGRIEYRSLPNNIDLEKLQGVLTKLLKGL